MKKSTQITTKLRINAIIFAILIIIVGALAVNGIYDVKQNVDILYLNKMAPIKAYKQLADIFTVDFVAEVNNLTSVEANKQEIKSHILQVKVEAGNKLENYKTISNYLQTNEITTNELNTMVANGNNLTDKVLILIEKESDPIVLSRQITNLLRTDIFPYIALFNKSTNNFISAKLEESKGLMAKSEASFLSARIKITVFTMVMAIIFIIISRVFVTDLKKKIAQTNNAFELISKGDLTQQISIVNHDEIGEMLSNLNQTQVRLANMVKQIIEGIHNFQKISNELNQSSQSIAEGASSQATSSEELSSSIEQMGSNIKQNAHNAMETEKVASQSVNELTTAATMTKKASETIQKISEKISIITDISFQTNILALNAAVEAARAGEHGKGFAVVASEVRKLAEKSKIAADEILNVSSQGLSDSIEANRRIQQVLPQIERTSSLVNNIFQSTREQELGINQIENAVNQLNKIVQQNAGVAGELTTSAEAMNTLANKLKEMVHVFKITNEIRVLNN